MDTQSIQLTASRIYFDNAATSFPKPQKVISAAVDYMTRVGANPGRSGHAQSLEALEMLFHCRSKVANFFSLKNPNRVIFTSNSTDALNITLLGLINRGDHVICSAMEHNSVARPLTHLAEQGKIILSKLKSFPNGLIDLDDFCNKMKADPRIVVINHSSNVSGITQDLEYIAGVCKERDLILVIDASQSAGNIPISLRENGISVLCTSGHKSLLGPTGTGLMLIADDFDYKLIKPGKFGGTGSLSDSVQHPQFLPDYFECGTLNVAGINGLKAGIDFLMENDIINKNKKEALAKLFNEMALKNLKTYRTYSDYSIKNTGICAFNLEGIPCSEISDLLSDRYGIMCRTGLHCAPWAHQILGTFPDGCVRFSFGLFNTEEEVALSIEALCEIEKSYINK